MTTQQVSEFFDSLDSGQLAPLGEKITEQTFINEFAHIQRRVHETAKSKGWWDNPRNDGELVALTHSELSEALEGMRHGNPPDDKIPEFSSAEAEYADAIIRMMDHCQARGWRLGAAIIAKMDFNETRPIKHGGKLF